MEPQKKQQLLIIGLIIILISMGLVLFFGLRKNNKGEGEITDSSLGLGENNLSKPLKSIFKDIDFDFLKNSQFKALK